MIEGNISVKAVLLAGKRKVKRIYVDQKKEDKDTRFILSRAKEKNIEIIELPREEINEMAVGKTHGGLLAEVEERSFENIKDLLDIELPFFALVEGVEDPFNLGYMMRSLYSAGCDGIFLQKRDWSMSEEVILKASAGAYEYMNIIYSESLVDDIQTLKDKGIKVYAAMRKDAMNYDEANYSEPLLLMLGGEMRGLSSQVLALADQNVYIPYANDFHNALNASSAMAVFAFEIKKQRDSLLK